MDTSELESNMGIETEVVDQYSAGDQYVAVVYVYGPCDVPEALRGTRAGMRALETLDIADGTIEDIQSHFTDPRRHEMLTTDNIETFTAEADGDWFTRQMPDHLLARDDIDVDDLEILSYQFTLDRSVVEDAMFD